MTQDEIIRMAREAGALVFQSNFCESSFDFTLENLERFAALVAAHEREKLHNEIATLQCDIEEMYSRADVDYLIGVEREACAKVCDKYVDYYSISVVQGSIKDGCEYCAAAIRARGNK